MKPSIHDITNSNSLGIVEKAGGLVFWGYFKTVEAAVEFLKLRGITGDPTAKRVDAPQRQPIVGLGCCPK